MRNSKIWSIGKYTFLIFAIIAISLVAFVGCSKKQVEKADAAVLDKKEPVVIKEPEKPKAPENKEAADYAVLEPGMAYSLINGEKITKEAFNQRPVCVMLDNYFFARPQAGTESADIIYEIMVEGTITRYMAVFQSKIPDDIGPIRSARPYFIRLNMEYSGLYTHVGGSEDAKSDLKAFNVNDLDGMSCPSTTFFRKSHKKIPHNMYSTATELLSWADKRGYSKDFKIQGLKFGFESGQKSAQSPKTELKFVFMKPYANDIGYFSEFKYDVETKKYKRYVNGEPHVDETTKNQLTAKSVIIQKAGMQVLDNEGRLKVDIVGSGEGYYAHEGVIEPITWKKADDRARTVFYTKDGEELVILPGKIWVEVVSLSYEP